MLFRAPAKALFPSLSSSRINALIKTSHRLYTGINSRSNLIRNVAIIAHVDHGKTSLVDCLLRQSGSLEEINPTVSRVMDSGELERERGITILSKSTSIEWKGHEINIVDTPGHADFGGEVERALQMVEGVILVVDATEGPMAQTKYVLSKAIERRLLPIVVQNKVDRESSRCTEVDCEILELFISLGANAQQLDYSTFYASARQGWALPNNPFKQAGDKNGNMHCILDAITKTIPKPQVQTGPFSMLVNAIENVPFFGKAHVGKVYGDGTVKVGDLIKVMSPDGRLKEQNRILKIFSRRGVKQVEMEEAVPGQIVSIAGAADAKVNDTIAAPSVDQPIKSNPVDPPTVSMTFLPNESPISGREGIASTKQILMRKLSEECDNDPSMAMEKCADSDDAFQVSGRGELQLCILIEKLRREGYELAVSPPRVVYKQDGQSTLEPVEEVFIDCEAEYSGIVIEKLTRRKAELVRIDELDDSRIRSVFTCPTRGLIGYLNELKNDTKGTGVLNHVFSGYSEYKGAIQLGRKGSIISMAEGVTTAYALSDLESRGRLFVGPGIKVYAGMVIGESSRPFDIEVNPCRSKALTNVRTTVKEEFYRLPPPTVMSLEETISYMLEDEMLEVTPQSLRLRKAVLDASARKRRKAGKQ